MSFPPVPPPDDFVLSSLDYSAVLPQPQFQQGQGSPLDYGEGVTTTLFYQAATMGVSFSFSPPGEFGAFSMAEAEAVFEGAVMQVLDVMAGMSGVPAGELLAQVTVTLSWGWVSPSTGLQFSQQDTISFPADTDASAARDSGEIAAS